MVFCELEFLPDIKCTIPSKDPSRMFSPNYSTHDVMGTIENQPRTGSVTKSTTIYPRTKAVSRTNSTTMSPQTRPVSGISSTTMSPWSKAVSGISSTTMYPQNSTVSGTTSTTMYPQSRAVSGISSTTMYPQNSTVSGASSTTMYPQSRAVSGTSSKIMYPQQPTRMADQEAIASGQIWAILGCVLTIGNIIAAVGFYFSRRRKKKLRKAKKDGALKEDYGNVPSDSHYTLPTNQDHQYHQIMINPEGLPVDDSGYLTVIERYSGKNSGYMEMSHFSSSQRSNSYQEIQDYCKNTFPPTAHSYLHASRSLDGEWCEQNFSDNSSGIAMKRIHKKREKYLVNIDIPSFPTDEGEMDAGNDVRNSCVLSPELMDEDLFESLKDFARYFTTLSVKKKKQLESAEGNGERSETVDDKTDEESNADSTANKHFVTVEIKTEKRLSETLQSNICDTDENGVKIKETNVSNSPLNIHEEMLQQDNCNHHGSIEEQLGARMKLTQEPPIPTQTDNVVHHPTDDAGQKHQDEARKFERLADNILYRQDTQQYTNQQQQQQQQQQ